MPIGCPMNKCTEKEWIEKKISVNTSLEVWHLPAFVPILGTMPDTRLRTVCYGG